MRRRIDFSIGPVQGFISRSRRTRDLWASSYLLAFLSAHAICGARNAGAAVVQPLVDDDLLIRQVCGEATDVSSLGTVPNHFVVETDGAPNIVTDAMEDAVGKAWNRVCEAVWDRFVAGAAGIGNSTEAIWQRQVSTFWEVTWTAGPAADYANLRARRKHWRSQCPPDEPGDKCTVMHDLQELSGYVRIRAIERDRQERFWNRIRSGVGPFDLRDNERLSAIALTKRLFPRVAEHALGWEVDTANWPSTVYVGAVPWIRRVVTAAPDAAREYADTVEIAAGRGAFRSRGSPFAGLGTGAAGNFPKLEANYMDLQAVRNKNRCPLEDEDDRQALADELRSLHDRQDDDGRLGSPSSFYALLLADGDRLGRLVSALGSDKISKALGSFTRAVPRMASEYDGVTVYAGGDDVLLTLPVHRALECADELSRRYRRSFAAVDGIGNDGTLSASVVFAHVRMPMSAVLDEAHKLLDDFAKDGNGRSSLAVGVLKPGGRYCRWVSAWVRDPAGVGARAVQLLHELVEVLRPQDGESPISSSLIYRTRKMLALLCGMDRWEPGNWGTVPECLELGPLLRAEISHSLASRTDVGSDDGAGELADRIVNLLGRSRSPEYVRVDDPLPHRGKEQGREVGVDALLLAKFLADPDEWIDYP